MSMYTNTDKAKAAWKDSGTPQFTLGMYFYRGTAGMDTDVGRVILLFTHAWLGLQIFRDPI